MRRPGRCRSSNGLLLLEVALAGAVLGVSLMVIGRALSTSTRAMQRAQRTQLALQTAQAMLDRLVVTAEMSGQFSGAPQGAWEASGRTYTWRAQIEPFTAPHALVRESPYALGQLTIAVQETQAAPVQVRLSTLIPRTWIPEDWPQSP